MARSGIDNLWRSEGSTARRVALKSRSNCQVHASPAAGSRGAADNLPLTSLYTSQAYAPRRSLGPARLEIVPGKGLGWRASRDVATGELLLVSLPVAVLYGAPGEPPDNGDLEEVLRQSWPRLEPLERRWLHLLGDCCTASSGARPALAATGEQGATATGIPTAAAAAGRHEDQRVGPAMPAAAPRPPLDALLARAQALLAEAKAGALGEEGAGAVVVGPQAEAGFGERFPADVAADVAPAGGVTNATGVSASSLEILPPSIFGFGAIGPGGGNATSSRSRSGAQEDRGVVSGLVSRYSYCEAREDPAVAELMDVAPVSCAGLWPEMALLNHSCCPNVAVLVVGGAMYLRAGRPVLEGEELTVSYLGRGVFGDVAERRTRLRASHGFVCCCPRCIMEQEHFPTRRYPDLERQQQQLKKQKQLQQQNQKWRERDAASARTPVSDSAPEADPSSSYSSSSSSSGSGGGGEEDEALDDALLAASLLGRRGQGPLQPLLDMVFGPGRFRTNVALEHGLLRAVNEDLVSELEAAAQAVLTAASRPRQQQSELLARLEGILEQVEASCAFLELPPRGRLMVLASVYGVVRLTCDLAELSQQATPERRLELLRLQAEVLEAVAPGSDSHVSAAVKAAGVARRVHGAEGAAARRAELAAASAHVARYGRELMADPALLRRMAATRRKMATGLGLAASMGVLAWAQQVESE